jgi:hypothetical protein
MQPAPAALTAQACVKTTLAASRYLGQLCKHFEHKLPATYDEGFRHGRIEFPFGTCVLAAEAPDALVMTATAATAEDLERLENVVARHLERFAFRETFTIDWQSLA